MPPGFQGDLSPRQVWDALLHDPRTVLIDVRTKAEWNFVGAPDLSQLGRNALTIEWQSFPGMALNDHFLEDAIAALPADKSTPIYLLCRSGVRSLKAAHALAERGYTTWNISGGFEGDLDQDGHRGAVGGWKAAGLPWRQK